MVKWNGMALAFITKVSGNNAKKCICENVCARPLLHTHREQRGYFLQLSCGSEFREPTCLSSGNVRVSRTV